MPVICSFGLRFGRNFSLATPSFSTLITHQPLEVPPMPKVANVEILARALGRISPGEPKTYEALTVIPLLAPTSRASIGSRE